MSNRIKNLFSRNKQRKFSIISPKKINVDENKKILLVTMTGEPLQLARIHYDLSDKETIEQTFAKMKCMDFDPTLNRWVWNYHEEAKKIKFESSYNDIQKKLRPIVIGSFYLPTEQRMYLDVNSFDRTVKAIKFFDNYLSRKAASLSHIQVVNKWFEAILGKTPKQSDFFDLNNIDKPDGKSALDDIANDHTLSSKDKMALVQQNMNENLNKPMEEVESMLSNFYEDGIDGFEGALRIRKIIAAKHWQGNSTFSYRDIFQDIFPDILKSNK